MLSSRATSGLSPPVLPDANLEKLVLGHLAAAAREALSALADVPLGASDEGRAGRADTSDGSASDQFSGEPCRSVMPYLDSLFTGDWLLILPYGMCLGWL